MCTMLCGYAIDRIVLLINENPLVTLSNLQLQLNHLFQWYKK